MSLPRRRELAVGACALVVFWPGALIFGLPGVMGPYWQQAFATDRAAVGQILFYLLVAAGLFMYPTGRWLERLGPARLAAAGGLLCGLATLFLGRAQDIFQVYLWAFLVGVSSCFLYLPALSVAQRWYPQRRGLVSGAVNMAFGFSAALVSPVMGWMLRELGPGTMTLVSGLVAVGMGLLASPLVQPPPQPLEEPAAQGAPGPSLSAAQSLRTVSFWALWVTWALAGAAGIAMVSLSVAFGSARGLELERAVLILTAFNLTNGLSRLASGFLSDIIGRGRTMSLAFALAALAYMLLPMVQGLTWWALLAAVVGFSFGTLFAVSAPLASDCFGLEHFAAIFGLVFTAYGFAAGALGPWLAGHILDVTGGDFKAVFTYLAAFLLVSALAVRLVKRPGRAG